MTDLPNIVLIGGAGSGKTTIAKWLVEDYGYTHLAFMGVAPDPHCGSPRDWVLRTWGLGAINDRRKLLDLANAARALDSNVWVNSLLRELPDESRVVVDDCRLTNEYYGLMAQGFVSVRVTAPDELRENRLRANGKWVDGYLEDPIEHHLDRVVPFHTLNNDAELVDLFGQLYTVLTRERKRR